MSKTTKMENERLIKMYDMKVGEASNYIVYVECVMADDTDKGYIIGGIKVVYDDKVMELKNEEEFNNLVSVLTKVKNKIRKIDSNKLKDDLVHLNAMSAE